MATTISKAEKSYIQTSLLSEPPLRQDGRSLHDYRPISLFTSVAPLANGSARVKLGGTEVLAAVKLEVVEITTKDVTGSVSCSVLCSPAAYPFMNGQQQEDIQSDYTSLLQSVIGHSSLIPQNLMILAGKKTWQLNLDAVILSDSGNVYDVLFMACRAALWDTRVPRTRAVEYKVSKPTTGDVEMTDNWKAAVQTKKEARAADFELEDYWDQGEPLEGRENYPVAITLNLLPTVHIVDATNLEEQAVPLKLLILFSVTESTTVMQGMRLLGSGHISTEYLKVLLKDGESYARQLVVALDLQLKRVGS